MFIRKSTNFIILEDLKDPNFEVLWIKLRPARFPRGYSCTVLAIVYHPPSANDSEIIQYLSTCLSLIESRFSNCRILLVGDFYRLNTTRLRNNYSLKQIVNFPTCGTRTLASPCACTSRRLMSAHALALLTTAPRKCPPLRRLSKQGWVLCSPYDPKQSSLASHHGLIQPLKDLIRRPQRALAQGNLPMFLFLRNRVNRER